MIMMLFNSSRIYDKLGSGNFASVYQGVWKHENRTVDVGIKILKTDSNQVDKIKFLQEAAIMGQFLHANIVRLLGVVTVEEPVRRTHTMHWHIMTDLLTFCWRNKILMDALSSHFCIIILY